MPVAAVEFVSAHSSEMMLAMVNLKCLCSLAELSDALWCLGRGDGEAFTRDTGVMELFGRYNWLCK